MGSYNNTPINMPPFEVQPTDDSRKVIDRKQAEVEISREVDTVTVYMANGTRDQMSMVVRFVRRVDVDGVASYVNDGQVVIGQEILATLAAYEDAYRQVSLLAHSIKDAADAAEAASLQPTVIVEPPPDEPPPEAGPSPESVDQPTGDQNPPVISPPVDSQIIDLDRDREKPTDVDEKV